MNPTHVMGRRVIAFIIDYVLLAAAFAGVFYALATHSAHAELTEPQFHRILRQFEIIHAAAARLVAS